MTKKIKAELSITVIQRLFKACGSFASFYCIKKQDTHLKYIKPWFKIIKKTIARCKKISRSFKVSVLFIRGALDIYDGYLYFVHKKTKI